MDIVETLTSHKVTEITGKDKKFILNLKKQEDALEMEIDLVKGSVRLYRKEKPNNILGFMNTQTKKDKNLQNMLEKLIIALACTNKISTKTENV